MRTKLIPAVAVTVQVLLGNLCFMPMAFAMETMPMDRDMQQMEQVMEMVMTPANLMSPLHCEGCVTITRPRHHIPDMGSNRMPCNDGHCFSEHTPSTAVVTQSSQKDVIKVAMRPMPLFLELPGASDMVFRPRAGPETRPLITQTIVLRE